MEQLDTQKRVIKVLKAQIRVNETSIKEYKRLLETLEKRYKKEKIKFYYTNKKCSNCFEDLTDTDIYNETVYCESCRETDSILDYNCHISD